MDEDRNISPKIALKFVDRDGIKSLRKRLNNKDVELLRSNGVINISNFYEKSEKFAINLSDLLFEDSLPSAKLKEHLSKIFRESNLNFEEWVELATDVATSSASQKLTLPVSAPALWEKRDRSKEKDPIEFLRTHWGKFIDEGILYQDDIARLGDRKLVPTVRAWCYRQAKLQPEKAHEFITKDILPPPRQERSNKIIENFTAKELDAARKFLKRSEKADARKRADPNPTIS